MANVGLEDPDQNMYSALKKSKKFKEQNKHKLGKCNGETNKAETTNVEECIIAGANNIKINKYEVKNQICTHDHELGHSSTYM